MDLLDKLRANNCDVDDALKRFQGRTDIYLNLVKKFCTDTSLEDYFDMLEKKDYDAAFRNVHNIKGISASFGFTDLCNISSKICEAYREHNYDYALTLGDELKSQHNKITILLTEE